MGHSIAGIDRQVHDDLHDLPWVRLDFRQRGVEQYFLLDIFSHQALQHFLVLSYQRVQVHHFGLEYLPAAEGKQLQGQRSCVLPGLFDTLEPRASKPLGT